MGESSYQSGTIQYKVEMSCDLEPDMSASKKLILLLSVMTVVACSNRLATPAHEFAIALPSARVESREGPTAEETHGQG